MSGSRHTEEVYEYRDQNGRLLDDEEVKALEGKVSFSTRYETRTRLVDTQGNELAGDDGDGVAAEDAGVAGTIAEGENQETSGAGQEAPSASPPHVEVAADLAKEKSVEASRLVAEPESDAVIATGKDEL